MGIIDFDGHTPIGLLFWTNLTCLTLTCAYVSCHREALEGKAPWSIIAAAKGQGIANYAKQLHCLLRWNSIMLP